VPGSCVHVGYGVRSAAFSAAWYLEREWRVGSANERSALAVDVVVRFAARITDALDNPPVDRVTAGRWPALADYCREQVASDLAVYRECEGHSGLLSWVAAQALGGLLRTGSLVGVTE